MESRFKLRLDSGIEQNDINAATILCLSSEYLIDLIKDVFKKYNKDGKLNDYLDEFTRLVDNSYEVSFTNFSSWIASKSNIFVSMLDVVKRCDEYLSETGTTSGGQVATQVQTDLNEFAMSLGTIVVDHDSLELGGAVVKQEYIDSTIEQLNLMNESYMLCKLTNAQIEMTPLDVTEYKNVIVEKKIKALNSVTESAKKTFDDDYDKLIDLVMSMYGKFYKISNASLTDGEKVESARKLVKELNPHKKLLDKLENKLTKGNELKRQLTLHKSKLLANQEEEIKRLDEQAKEDSVNVDIYESNKSTLKFATDEYVSSIDVAVSNINNLEESIANRYKMLDLLNSSLKSSIPTEGELKKLSAIPFKFQELANKQENAKSTITDKVIKDIISTTIKGLKSLVVAGTDLKELYMRNSMVSATFKTVDVILDFAESDNKGERLKNMLVVNTNLEKYSKLSIKMAEDFFNARKIANDTIRNIAMTMCKPYTKKSLKEIAEQIEICFEKMNEYIKSLDADNREEITLIKEILSL